MATTSDEVDGYLESAPAFALPILLRIRSAFHEGCPDVVESMKWGGPHFAHHGLLGGMRALKARVVLGLWKGADIDDPHGLLSRAGITKIGHVKLASLADLPPQEVLVEYVRRAAEINEAATKGEESRARRRATTIAPLSEGETKNWKHEPPRR